MQRSSTTSYAHPAADPVEISSRSSSRSMAIAPAIELREEQLFLHANPRVAACRASCHALQPFCRMNSRMPPASAILSRMEAAVAAWKSRCAFTLWIDPDATSTCDLVAVLDAAGVGAVSTGRPMLLRFGRRFGRKSAPPSPLRRRLGGRPARARATSRSRSCVRPRHVARLYAGRESGRTSHRQCAAR